MAGNLKAKVTFLADVKGLLKGVDSIEGRLNKLGGTMERHSRGFMVAGGAIMGALGGLAAQGIAYGTTIDRMAESAGQTHEEMSRLAYSAELYHGSAEKVEKGVRSLAQKMLYAKDGMATYRREFERAGIDVDAWGDKLPPVNDILLELADSFAANADGSEVLASATVLLGGRQSELIPWMKQGSAAIREQFGEAEKLGQVLDSETSKAMETLGTEMKNVRLMARGIGVDIALAAAPAIEGLTGNLRDLVEEFKSWSPATRTATIEMGALSGATLLGAAVMGQIAPLIGGAAATIGGPLVLSLFGAGAAWIGLNAVVEKANTLIREGSELQAVGATGLKAWAMAARNASTGIFGFVHGLRSAREEWEDLGAEMQGPSVDEWLDAKKAEEDLAKYEARIKALSDRLNSDLVNGLSSAATAASVSETSFANFMETIGLGQQPLEDFTVLMERLGFGASITAEAVGTIVGPLTEAGEGIAALSELTTTTFDEMTKSMVETLPRAAKAMVSSFGRVYGELGALDKMTWKTMKKAAAQGLKSMLDMFIDATLGKLLATKIEEIAALGMKAFSNPAALAYIGVIAGIYGTAKAAIGGINSFDESATFTRGGQITGSMTIGDTIISPDAMKNLMKGDMGGTTITVNANFNGVYGGDESDFQRDADSLVEAIELAMER